MKRKQNRAQGADSETHPHDILDEVLLPVLLPRAGHQVVVHLDDAPAGDRLRAQGRHEGSVERAGSVAADLALLHLDDPRGGGGRTRRAGLRHRWTGVGVVFGSGELGS